jgi:hypothetical protein
VDDLCGKASARTRLGTCRLLSGSQPAWLPLRPPEVILFGPVILFEGRRQLRLPSALPLKG